MRQLGKYDIIARKCIAGLRNSPIAMRRNIARALQDLEDENERYQEDLTQQVMDLTANLNFSKYNVSKLEARLKQYEECILMKPETTDDK